MFLLMFFNLVLWNVFTPVFEAADEQGYYQHAYFLAHEKRLPNLNNPPQNAGVMSYPPTYYLPLVPVVWLTQAPSGEDPAIIEERLNYRQGWRHQTFNRFQHTREEALLKWGRLEWVVHLMRLVTNLWGMGAVILVYLAAREFFGDENKAMLASLFVGFNPMFAHLHSTVIVVNLLVFLASLTWYWLIKWKKLTFRRAITLGLVIGLATITKATGLLLLPIALFKLRHYRKWLWATVVGFGLSSGWWWVRNFILYGSLLATDKVIATTGTRAFMAQSTGAINYWVGFFTSQWATFWTGYGWSSVYFSKIILMDLFILMIIVGWRAIKSAKRGLGFLIGAVLFWVVMLMVAHANFPAFHAKDIYPMIVPISIFVTAGLPKLSGRYLTSVIVTLFLINVAYLLLDVSPKLFGQVL